MRPFIHFLARRKLLSAIAITLTVVGVAWAVWSGGRQSDPSLVSPSLAMKALPSGSLYYNPAARPWLLAQRPELLVAADHDLNSPRSRNFAQAVLNPKVFRQLDRQERFATLLFVGDPSQYRPLLDHLLDSKDWNVSYLDHTAILFRRGEETAWNGGDLTRLRERFERPEDAALFLAQAASKLIAVRQGEKAEALLEEAARLKTKVPDVANAHAILHMSRGQWAQAVAQVNRALSLDDEFLPALATKAQLLYSMKKFPAAYDVSKKLIERSPSDPGLLFYHAKIAHEAHAYGEETRALEKLIALAEAEERPTTGYRLYLAQAYAAAGKAKPAIEQFQVVLADPDLPKEQRSFAQDTLAQVKSRSGF